MTVFSDLTDLTNCQWQLFKPITSLFHINYTKLPSVEKKSKIHLCFKHNL